MQDYKNSKKFKIIKNIFKVFTYLYCIITLATLYLIFFPPNALYLNNFGHFLYSYLSIPYFIIYTLIIEIILTLFTGYTGYLDAKFIGNPDGIIDKDEEVIIIAGQHWIILIFFLVCPVGFVIYSTLNFSEISKIGLVSCIFWVTISIGFILNYYKGKLIVTNKRVLVKNLFNFFTYQDIPLKKIESINIICPGFAREGTLFLKRPNEKAQIWFPGVINPFEFRDKVIEQIKAIPDNSLKQK